MLGSETDIMLPSPLFFSADLKPEVAFSHANVIAEIKIPTRRKAKGRKVLGTPRLF